MNGFVSATQAGLSCVVTVSVYGGLGPFPGAIAVVDQLGDAQHRMRVIAGPQTTCSWLTLATLQTWLEASQELKTG